jgi:hypothetical protein
VNKTCLIENEHIWCTYAHIKPGSFISHPTITHFFLFQPSHAPLRAYLVHMACGRVETKKTSYRWMRDERLRFNVCMCAPRCHVHQIYSLIETLLGTHSFSMIRSCFYLLNNYSGYLLTLLGTDEHTVLSSVCTKLQHPHAGCNTRASIIFTVFLL